MRTRKEIWTTVLGPLEKRHDSEIVGYYQNQTLLEVLLDIRDFLIEQHDDRIRERRTRQLSNN